MKDYKNRVANMALRRKDPGIRQIKFGKPTSRVRVLEPILAELEEMDCTAGQDRGMSRQEVLDRYPGVVPKAMFPEGETVE